MPTPVTRFKLLYIAWGLLLFVLGAALAIHFSTTASALIVFGVIAILFLAPVIYLKARH